MNEQEHPDASALRLRMQRVQEATNGLDWQEIENVLSQVAPRILDLYLLSINNARYWLDSVERRILEEQRQRLTLMQQSKAEDEA